MIFWTDMPPFVSLTSVLRYLGRALKDEQMSIIHHYQQEPPYPLAHAGFVARHWASLGVLVPSTSSKIGCFQLSYWHPWVCRIQLAQCPYNVTTCHNYHNHISSTAVSSSQLAEIPKESLSPMWGPEWGSSTEVDAGFGGKTATWANQWTGPAQPQKPPVCRKTFVK